MNDRTVSAPSSEPASSAPTDDLGQSARRGALFIPLAKLWFMMAALLLQLLLPRALGSAALYGVWTLVSSWLSTLNNVMITATIQAVAYFAAGGPSAVEQAKKTALKMNLLIGGGSAALFFLLAPTIANFEHDGELTSQLQLGSLIILAYSFYAVFVGAANGARQFHKQAGLDITFATMRTGLAGQSCAIAGLNVNKLATQVSNWVKNFEGGGAPSAFIDTLRRGDAWHGRVAPVTRLYSAYFERLPDFGGYGYWTGRLRAGSSLKKVSDTFAASSEFKNKYGPLSNTAFVQKVYQNVLHRAPDSAASPRPWSA